MLGLHPFVFLSDLVELFHVLLEVWTLLQSDEQLSLLAVSSRTLHSDGSSLNLLESCILVPKDR